MSRGIERERKVRRKLEDDGWWTARAAGSLGDADVIALKAGEKPWLLEVKSDAEKFGPFNNLGPERRRRLAYAALKAGAKVSVAYWPPHGELRFIPPSEWPSS